MAVILGHSNKDIIQDSLKFWIRLSWNVMLELEILNVYLSKT